MRRDIQLLRGIAVLFVVIYHSGLGAVSYGYLGVDVFFVVSGFLITSIVIKGLDANSFSFGEFYLRRAKRLLPALYSTLVGTSVLAYFFLTAAHWEDYISQLIGAVSFSENVVLPFQTGYFEADAEGKPLLHIWSLSLEEQYYFFLPLALLLVPTNWRMPALLALFSFSLIWCFSWVVQSGPPPLLWRLTDAAMSEWSFYLLPTRAWELLAGSICAATMLRKPELSIPVYLKIMALLTILLIGCVNFDDIHPRGDALIIVLATCIIVLGQDDWLPSFKALSFIERVGDWSYSIYLVHWPLFAFAFLAYLGQVPVEAKIALLLSSVILGYLQYQWIEQPFRHGWQSKGVKAWRWFAVSTVLVFIVPIPSVYSRIAEDDRLNFEEIRRINHGMSKECEGSFSKNGELKNDCRSRAQNNIAVWGDSYAMHLVPGIEKSSGGIIQLTKSVCGPFLDIAPVTKKYNKDWAEHCLAHNNLAISEIVNNEAIDLVILSSAFGQYMNETDGGYFLMSDGRLLNNDRKIAVNAMIETIERLKDAGKSIVLVSPPPRAGFNIGECLEREHNDLVLMRKNCVINVSDYLDYEQHINQSLQDIAAKTKTPVIWLADYLCTEEQCNTKLDDVFIYRDNGHLSITGSEKLLSNIEWR